MTLGGRHEGSDNKKMDTNIEDIETSAEKW